MDYTELLLTALENRTRREILKCLVEGERYALQLSKELKLSQQAIIKNLVLLEKYKLIKFDGIQKSNAGPPRKTYKIGDSVLLTIALTENMFEIKTQKLGEYDNKMHYERILHQNIPAIIDELNDEIEQVNQKLAELVYLKDRMLGLYKEQLLYK